MKLVNGNKAEVMLHANGLRSLIEFRDGYEGLPVLLLEALVA